MDVDL